MVAFFGRFEKRHLLPVADDERVFFMLSIRYGLAVLKSHLIQSVLNHLENGDGCFALYSLLCSFVTTGRQRDSEPHTLIHRNCRPMTYVSPL